MKKEEIIPGDLRRILFGEAPVAFLAEVAIRSTVLYLALLLIVKWLGKRMSGQLTIMEMSIMLMLGAIVSAPMQVPEIGILQGILILVTVLGLYWCASRWAFVNKRFERTLHGTMTILVKDGTMQTDNMHRARVSRQQLFAQLRKQRIFNLGEVERCYLEACGIFSIYKYGEPWPGESLFPEKDTL